MNKKVLPQDNALKRMEVSCDQRELIHKENQALRYEPHREKTGFFAYMKTKTQISFAVT